VEKTESTALWPYINVLRQSLLLDVKTLKPKALRQYLTEAIQALDTIETRIKQQAERNEADK
jgi:hypothetical protein